MALIRYLYAIDEETGREIPGTRRYVTDMNEREILAAEEKLRADCGEGVTIRDSAND